jgi:hypothetical protein
VYLGAKACLYIGGDVYNRLSELAIAGIGEDEDRRDGLNRPKSVWSVYLLQVVHNNYCTCYYWRIGEAFVKD